MLGSPEANTDRLGNCHEASLSGRDLLAIAPDRDAPHFVQVGGSPVFGGTGVGELLCRCGASVLIQGYLPGNFLAIRIQCSSCGAVTSTPGLPDGEILPRSAVGIEAVQTPMTTTSGVARGEVLVCRDAIARNYALTRPRNPPDEPMPLSRAMLEAAAADYDRLTGGRLAEHTAASPSGESSEHGDYPFAWSVLRLRERIGRPGWSWLYQDDDAMAAMYVTAIHRLMQCWGQHPLLDRLTAPLTGRGKFIRVVIVLAMAKLLFDAGNRVGFSLSGSDVDLHFTTTTDEPLTFALLAPDVLQWREKDRRSPDVLRNAVIDAMAAAQRRVNRSRPGIVVLATSILRQDFDQMVVDAIHAAFQKAGRRHRGVAAVAVVLPKLLPAGQPDWIGFGYAFYPIQNPRFAGENPIRLGTPQDSRSGPRTAG